MVTSRIKNPPASIVNTDDLRAVMFVRFLLKTQLRRSARLELLERVSDIEEGEPERVSALRRSREGQASALEPMAAIRHRRTTRAEPHTAMPVRAIAE